MSSIAAAAPIELVVTTGGDTSDPNDGVLTLREAVADQATAQVSARITFAPGVGEVVLTQGELLVTGTSAATGAVLTIDGGAGGVTLTQDVPDGSRVMHVDGASNGIEQAVVLQDVTITGGVLTSDATGFGAGLLGRNAAITLDDVTVTGNRATAGDNGIAGGGLGLSRCTTTITGGAVTDNVVVASAGYGSGGGIFAYGGSLVLSGTEVSGNSASGALGPVFGGGIALSGTQGSFSDATVEQNTATVTGDAGYAAGGGISAIGQGRLTLSYVTLSANTAKGAGSAYGGGVFGTYELLVEYSLVTGNVVEADASAFGGGIAMGGVGSTLGIVDSTVTGNTLDAARAYGAGVEANGSVVSIDSATIVGNSTGGAPGVGGVDVSRASGQTAVTNSIIAQNSGTTADVAGTIGSNGHNLFSQLDIVGQQPGDIVALDAKLGALGDNGGPTQTMAPQAGSPVLDAGSDADAVGPTDQRGTGFARISGGHTDIGAYETQTVGGVERLFTPGDNTVDLRKLDLALYPGAIGTDALAGDDTVHLSNTQNLGTLFVAGRGDDIVFGGARADKLTGSQGDDRIGGGGGGDLLYGGIGNDRLHGDGGKDTLKGSAGADTFIFTKIGDSPTGAGRDVILDFMRRQGDLIDLGKIDANAGLSGNQAFVWKGAGPLTGAGQLHYQHVGSDTIIEGNLSGSAAPEIQIELHGHLTLAAGDFLL